MLKDLGQFIAVIFLVLLGSHDFAQYFFKEKGTRRYWIKWWIVVSIIFATAFWLLLLVFDT
jgi:hypothetical protein